MEETGEEGSGGRTGKRVELDTRRAGCSVESLSVREIAVRSDAPQQRDCDLPRSMRPDPLAPPPALPTAPMLRLSERYDAAESRS